MGHVVRELRQHAVPGQVDPDPHVHAVQHVPELPAALAHRLQERPVRVSRARLRAFRVLRTSFGFTGRCTTLRRLSDDPQTYPLPTFECRRWRSQLWRLRHPCARGSPPSEKSKSRSAAHRPPDELAPTSTRSKWSVHQAVSTRPRTPGNAWTDIAAAE